MRCQVLPLCALLLGLAVQAQAGTPSGWAVLGGRFPEFAGALVDVQSGYPRLTLLWAGAEPPSLDDLTAALGEEAREIVRGGVVQVRPARFTLTQLLAAEQAVGSVGRFDPLLNRVVVPPGTPPVRPAGITVTTDEVARESRLDVFVRPTSPAREALVADVRVVNTGRWPVRAEWDCFVVRLRVLDAQGRNVTSPRDDEACAGGPEVVLWPGEVRRADPILPVLEGLPAGRYRLRAELDVAGLRAAREATLDWRP